MEIKTLKENRAAYTIKEGTKPGAIEIYFASKPSAEAREALKGLKMRWNGSKKCWYGFASAADVAEALQGEKLAEQPKKLAKVAKASKLAPLWERCQVSAIPEHSKHETTKTIAAETRAQLKTLFPECRFSVRIGRGRWSAANTVSVDILSSPYALEKVAAVRWGQRCTIDEPSAPLRAVYEYVKAWLWSYNYDHSDSMTDYFDRGFYESINIRSSEYKQTEPTAEQLADVANFMQKKAEEEERAKAEAHARYIREKEERAKEAEEAEKKHRENIASLAEIENGAQVQDLAESEQYFITNLISGIGKENSLEEVREDVAEYGGHLEKLAHISRRVVMSAEHWEKFSALFMYDTALVAKFGGTATDDPRVTADNIMKLNKEQREAVEFYPCNCVAVYTEDENGETLRAVIDPQGYNYSRYVYIPTEETTDNGESYTEYKERAEAQSLAPFFFPSAIEEQAKEAAAHIGEPVTALYIDPWALTVRTICGTLRSASFTPYAQHKNNMRVEIGKFCANIHAGAKFLLYPGTLPDTPESLRASKISDSLTRLNFCGEGAGDYIKECANYYNALGFEPIVDNVQR